MTQAIDMKHEAKEVDYRENDGIEVRLLWQPGETDVVVEVVDSRLGDSFRLEVAGADAMEAFHHPFAFAARSGVEFGVPQAA